MAGKPKNLRNILMNAGEWANAKKRAKAAYDPVCVLCGGDIDMDGPPFQPLSCEVDHIQPVSRGGSIYELENLQLTHHRCNRKKGAKVAGDYKGLDDKQPFPISTDW